MRQMKPKRYYVVLITDGIEAATDTTPLKKVKRGYVKGINYDKCQFLVTEDVLHAKQCKTFDEASGVVDTLVRFNQTIRATILPYTKPQ